MIKGKRTRGVDDWKNMEPVERSSAYTPSSIWWKPKKRSGGYSTIAEVPGLFSIERFDGEINGKRVIVGKVESGGTSYSVYVNGREIVNGVSEGVARAALERNLK